MQTKLSIVTENFEKHAAEVNEFVSKLEDAKCGFSGNAGFGLKWSPGKLIFTERV